MERAILWAGTGLVILAIVFPVAQSLRKPLAEIGCHLAESPVCVIGEESR
jgi:hypothetical protein